MNDSGSNEEQEPSTKTYVPSPHLLGIIKGFIYGSTVTAILILGCQWWDSNSKKLDRLEQLESKLKDKQPY